MYSNFREKNKLLTINYYETKMVIYNIDKTDDAEIITTIKSFRIIL